VDFRRLVLALTVVLAFAPAALARSDFKDLPASAAAESALGKERLLDVPFFLAGQKHGAVAQELGEFRTNKRSNAFGKSDEEACQVAFLSAIISRTTAAWSARSSRTWRSWGRS
jgi:hypothetical protein